MLNNSLPSLQAGRGQLQPGACTARVSIPRATPLFLWLALWAIAVLFGFQVLARHSTTPGLAAEAQASSSPPRIRLDAELPTLLVFVHPLCPCTRATLNELERVLEGRSERVRTRILFRMGPELAIDLDANEHWLRSKELPDVELERDEGGRLAQALGVHTSGEVLLYAPDGRRLFAGGITASRGHEGANAGESELVELLDGKNIRLATAPVFGCPLSRADSNRGPQ